MSRQQFVFILLGIVIVGIAIVVGINVFTASGAQSNRDSVIAELSSLAALSQKYYQESVPDSSGNKSFSGWTIPASLDTTENGVYSAFVKEQSITLVGIGKEKGNNGIGKVQVSMVIAPDKIVSTIIDN